MTKEEIELLQVMPIFELKLQAEFLAQQHVQCCMIRKQMEQNLEEVELKDYNELCAMQEQCREDYMAVQGVIIRRQHKA